MSGVLLFTGFVFFFGLTTVGGLLMIKLHSQRDRDRGRTTYVLNFPEQLDSDRVVAWIRAISKTLRGSRFNAGASQTIVFETWATASGIVHRLKVPWQQEDDVIPQLRALAPGVTATPDTAWPIVDWNYAVEVGLTNSSRPLTIPNAQDVATSILAATQPLKDEEQVLIQWVLGPTGQARAPEPSSKSDTFHWTNFLYERKSTTEITERREKLAEPNLGGVLRVAAVAASEQRARHLTERIKTSYNATGNASTSWYRRTTPMKGVTDRARRAGSLAVWPAHLSVPEIVALIGWPLGSPAVSGLPQGTARQLPVTALVPTGDIVIGHSTFPGQEREIGIGFDQALMHTHVFGRTGSGKSVLLAHMARHIMNAGYGLICMETEGNLYQSVVNYIPRERIQDVIVLDLAEDQRPLGFNVLDQGNVDANIDSLIDLLEHLYGRDGMGVWAGEYIYHGLKSLGDVGGMSFTDLVPLLNPRSPEEARWADDVVRNLTDPELKRWWQRHGNRGKVEQMKRADPVLSRIWQLAARKELRNVFGQRTSSFQMSDVFRDNKILLINLKGVSSATSKLVGTLVMNAIWRAAKTTPKDKATYLLLDEFGDFMNLPINTESMLAQARKHKVGMILAHQMMAQLTTEVRSGVIANARNKIILNSTEDDAKLLIAGMRSNLTARDITNLRAYEAVADVMTPTGNSGPFSLGTKPEVRGSNAGQAAVAASRTTYGRAISDVTQAMYGQRTGRPETSDRPAETGEGW